MRQPRSGTWSLRRRLLWLVIAAIGLVTLLQAATAYRSALREADRMFDYHLQEVARSVHGGIPFAPGADISDYSVQVWGPDGTELYRSRGLQLPAQAVLGFSDSRVNGVRLRIYTLQTPEHTIQIAQDLDAREARARALAANAVMPIVLLAPLLMLAVGWVISDTLGPLRRMRKQVAQRAASDLSPLSATGMPEEVQPLVGELNALFGRVRETFEAQQHFVADAAHELRSPLTALKLQLQAATRAQDEAARQAAVQQLGAGIERAIALVEQLLDTKLLATLTTPALFEKALALCIEQGQLRRHCERIRTRLDAARSRSVKLALHAGCRFAAEPAGLFGWVDTGVDTDALSQRMLDEGYLLAPGALFHAERKPSTLMRINFATTQDAAFWKKYAELVKRM